ncbi:hypothetical protein C7E12_23005, partial [Stenotrophomonas maltophilia]
KELLGLVASMVLRCDDCISYHVAQCKDAGVTREEFFETFKELLGLVASMVLRCDDCISYHVAQCKDAGVTR